MLHLASQRYCIAYTVSTSGSDGRFPKWNSNSVSHATDVAQPAECFEHSQFYSKRGFNYVQEASLHGPLVHPLHWIPATTLALLIRKQTEPQSTCWRNWAGPSIMLGDVERNSRCFRLRSNTAGVWPETSTVPPHRWCSARWVPPADCWSLPI